ncbi:hypothetical protein AC629_42045 [Bradyrhizobium sp. NAS80.1]|uniref:O-antigen polymerase n=1 Tax=Bradyrhizobium sp. NAS80.1 TaxID=1680159 RepID=UPI00095B4314|nr:O-antigen polymerase [Bradyrhizobium sp. NAS80.1]OKO68561.1 hypothetical protein AC629_42045 [Bradyrhizobium sp. NAS80.1]
MKFEFRPERLSGERAFILGWSVWLVCFALMPITTMFYGDFGGIALLVAANLAVLVGILAGSRGREKGFLVYDQDALRIVLLLCVVLGTIAIFAKVVDLIGYRGILSARSFAQGREKMEANDINFFSGIHFLLLPVIYAGGILAIVVLVQRRLTNISKAALALYAINPVFSFVYGGRSTLVLAVALAGITLLVSLPALKLRHVMSAMATFLLLFGVTIFMFVSRAIERIGDTHVDRLAGASDYTKLVPLTDQTLTVMGALPTLGRFLLYYVMSVGQYILHGVFEFFYIVNVKDPRQGYLWGEYQFTLYQQARHVLMGAAAVQDLEVYNPATGLFSTFWGPAYLDFGPMMIVFGLAFGIAAGWAAQAGRSRRHLRDAAFRSTRLSNRVDPCRQRLIGLIGRCVECWFLRDMGLSRRTSAGRFRNVAASIA